MINWTIKNTMVFRHSYKVYITKPASNLIIFIHYIMVKIIKSQILYVDSQDKSSNQTSSNFSINIPKSFIETNTQNQKIRITLLDALIPRNFWAINSNNRTFTLRVGITDYTINLPLGFWNVLQLQTQLQTLLAAASSLTWVVAYDTNKNIYTFTFTGTFSSVQFIFTSNDAGDFLGFSNSTTYTFVAGELQSVKGISVQGENCLYLRTNLTNEIPNLEYGNNNTFSVSNILARIPIAVAPFANIIYQDYSNTYSLICEQNYIDQIIIRITDRLQNLIDLQTEWSLSLKIEIIETDDHERTIANTKNTSDILRLMLLSQANATK